MAELTDVIGLSAMMDMTAFNKGMSTYNQGLSQMNANTGKAAGGIMGSFGKLAKGIAIGVAAGVAAMGALAAGALKVGMEFDSAYDTIINRTGATGERLEQLKADANAVFRAMPTDIGQAADAVAILSQRLDLTGKAAQDLSKQMLMTGAGNVAGTTESLAKAMKAWGIETEDASITLDKLKLVSQKTGADFNQMLGTMALAAPTMKALGISGDQAIAMMGQLDKAGIAPTIMLTGLRTAMMKFSKSSGDSTQATGMTAEEIANSSQKLTELKNKLAIATQQQAEFTDKTKQSARMTKAAQIDKYANEIAALESGLAKASSGQGMVVVSGKSMADQLADTVNSIKNAKDQTAAMSIGMEMFGARSGPMMVQAIRTGAMSTDDLVKAMQGAQGTIESTYMATLDFPEKMQVMKNKVLSAIAPIGTSMMDYIGKAFDLLGPYVDNLAIRISTDLVPWLDKLVARLGVLYTSSQAGLATLATKLQPVQAGLQSAGHWLKVLFTGEIPQGATEFGATLQQIIPKADGVGQSALRLRDAFARVKEALQSAHEWIGRLADGLQIGDRIQGLTSQLTGLWDTVRSSFQSGAKGGGVEGGIESLLGLLGLNVDLAGIAGPIGKLADTLWGQVRSAFQGVTEGDVMGLATLPGQLRKTLATGLVTVGQGLSTTLGDMFPDLKPVLDTWIMPIWQVLGDVVTMFLDLKAQILPTILEVFGKIDLIGIFTSALAMVRDLIATIIPVVVQLAATVLPLAIQLLPILVGAFTSLLPVIQQLIPPIAQMVVALLPVLATVLGAVGPILTSLVPIFATILGVVTQIVADVLPVAISVITQVVNIITANMPLIQSIIETVLGTVLRLWDSVWPTVQKVIEKVMGVIGPLVETTIKGFQTLITTVLPVIENIWSRVWPIVQEVLERVMNALGPIVEGAMKTIQGIVGIYTGIFTGDWKKVWESAKLILEGAWIAIKGVFTALFGDIVKAVQDKMESIRQAIATKIEPILKPFKDIWEWIDKNLLPVFRALSTLVDAVVGKAFEIIAAIFKNKVLPALEDVHKQLADFLQPAFDAIGKVVQEVGGWVTDKLIEPLKKLFEKTSQVAESSKTFTGILDGMKKGLEGLGNVLGKVTGFFGGLTKKVNEFEVPALLEPGSPTPLELGLTGIAEAVSAVSKAFTKMANDMDMGEAEVFTEVTKSISRVIDSMRELITLTTTMGGGGPTALPDMTTFMASYGGFVKAVETVMTGLENELGYERIKQLAKLSMRFQEIFAALNIGDFQIKLFDASLVTQWSADLGVLAKALISVLVDLSDPALSKDVQTAEKMSPRIQTIVGFVQGAIDAVTALAEFTDVDSLTAPIANLHDRLIEIIPQLVDVAKKISTSDIEAIATILTSAQTIVGFVQPAIDALNALAKYETKGSRSVADGIDVLAQDMIEVVEGLKYASKAFDEDGNKLASAIWTAAQGMVNFITPAIDALTALASYKTKGERSVNESIDAFAQDMIEVIQGLKYASKAFDEEGNKLASAIWTAAMGMVGFISPAIAALTALSDYRRGKTLVESIGFFTHDAALMIAELIKAARFFTFEGIEVAGKIYGAATSITGGIEGAIKALMAIGDYVSPVSLTEGISGFLAGLKILVKEMVKASGSLTLEGVDAAADLYSGIGQIVGTVTPAIGALKGLMELPTLTGIEQLAEEFGAKLKAVVERLVWAFTPKKSRSGATETAPDWMDAYDGAATLLEDVQKIVGVFAPGIAALKALVELPALDTVIENAGLFAEKLRAVVVALVAAFRPKSRSGEPIEGWETAYTAAATMFGSIQQIVGVVKPAVEALNALLGYEGGDVGKAAARFETDMGLLMNVVNGLKTRFETSGVDSAERLKNAMLDMKDAIEEGLGAVTGLSAISVPGNVLSTVSEFARTVVHYLGFMEQTTREQIGNLVKAFQAARNPVVAALSDMTAAVVAFDRSLDDLSIPSWLEPGSPPPLAYALADVRKEMKLLENTYRHIPSLESAAGRYAGARSQTNVVNRSTSLGGIVIQATVNNEVDVQRLGDIVVQRVARAMAM